MRLLSHPNVVTLKNSFFSNGDKVRERQWPSGSTLKRTCKPNDSVLHKQTNSPMSCTSIWFWTMCPKPCIESPGITQK